MSKNPKLSMAQRQAQYMRKRKEYEAVEDQLRAINAEIELEPHRMWELKEKKKPLQAQERKLKREVAALRTDTARSRYELRVLRRIAKAAASYTKSEYDSDEEMAAMTAMEAALKEMDEFHPGWSDG